MLSLQLLVAVSLFCTDFHSICQFGNLFFLLIIKMIRKFRGERERERERENSKNELGAGLENHLGPFPDFTVHVRFSTCLFTYWINRHRG